MILRAAIRLPPPYDPKWVFIDDDADLSGISKENVRYETGASVTVVDNVLTADFTSILLGNVETI